MANTTTGKSGDSLRVARLRQQAEELLRTAPRDIGTMSAEAVQVLVYELQVYQVELEMQNEELHRVQHDLEESRNLYQDLFDFAPVGYLSVDHDGRIEQANLTAASLLGVDRVQLQGTLFAHFVVSDDQDTLHRHRQEVKDSGSHGCELRIQPQHGQQQDVRLETRAVREETRDAPVYRMVLLIITERKQAQAALQRAHAELELKVQERTAELTATNSALRAEITERRRAEGALRTAKERAEAADRVKGEFLATMSHELRTPLNIIMGYTDLLCDETLGALEAEQVRVLRRVEKSARELFDLISALLDVNRLEAGRLPVVTTAVPLPELLREIEAETQELLREKPAVCFEYMGAPGLSVLWTDRIKLKMVLKNLVCNAVKFTERGFITVHVRARDGGVDFCVTDTGVGIASEEQATIFEMFRQGDLTTAYHQGGVGLGLYIVRRMVELLEGTVTLESEKGRGSTFRVWVPKSRPATNIVAVKRPGQSA